ncbi:hypothetical protein ACL9RL_01845 [Plantibacter sp. Mn2098]|uniref:hypothetical protein n=1 Tax=Plantibacter sp. Mn2098 TaxID=3395266 RepID=UPI003BEDA761
MDPDIALLHIAHNSFDAHRADLVIRFFPGFVVEPTRELKELCAEEGSSTGRS